MGLTASSNNGNSRPASVLPIVGKGEYEHVGCADLMIAAESNEDTGLFARVFYPSSSRSDTREDPVIYPIWKPRKEYLDGLAEYRQMSPRKLHFFFDWIIGERRVPGGWHEPLFSLKLERERLHSTSLHGSKSSGQLSQNGTTSPTDSHNHLTSSQSESCLDDHDVKFPVIIFSHGISGNRLCYSTLCASFASYGFVVVALEHRDRSSCWSYSLETDSLSGIVIEKPILMTSYPDGEGEWKRCNKQLHKRVAECVKALNVMEELNLGICGPADKKPKGSKIILGHNFDWTQFKDRLDIQKAAVIGHSMGASSAIGSVAFSTDFATCVSLDGWLYPIENELYSQVTQPTLFINASKWQWVENIKRMIKLENSLERNIFTFNDIVHQTFSDFGFLMPGYVGRKFSLQGDLDPLFTVEAVMELVVAHLHRCFKKEPAIDCLREVAKNYEHFVFEGTDLNLDEDDNNKSDSPTSDEMRTGAPNNVEFEPPTAELTDN